MAARDIQPGDLGEVAQLGLLGGGLLRTWTDAGSRLWSVEDPEYLRSLLGRGQIARTQQAEGRFREAGTLFEERGVLMLQSRVAHSDVSSTTADRVAFDGAVIELGPPKEPDHVPAEELRDLIAIAVKGALSRGEYLVAELGGWDAPAEPYCLWIVLRESDATLSLVEAAPPPTASDIWREHINESSSGVSLRAPLGPGTLSAVPALMVEAMRGWGIDPWSLALTFGQAPES